MPVDVAEFLLAVSGVSATLLGTFIVGVFFYLDLSHYRSATSKTIPIDRYMRVAVRWVFVAYSLPLLLPLVLVFAEPIWGALTFLALITMLLAATVGTVRQIVTQGGAGSSMPLILNEWITTVAVLIAFVLPWLIGGWTPAPSEYIPSLVITIAAGFASTAALVISEFDSTIALPNPEEKRRPRSRRGTRRGHAEESQHARASTGIRTAGSPSARDAT
ncbi:hypothetical protein [Nesterenkonia sp. CF4.4]|uniref:hypothetical protein n=1 Tax=Nesterenkonia sp. CF4.4 TaxID=3373079 RepID=UPI003EE6E212